YGMDGYRYEDGGNMVGFKREVATAYPAMIRDELASRFGADNVDLEQLAISGFRMDELHCLLDEEFVGDDYHYKYFNSWFDNLVAKWKKYESDDYYSKYTDGQDTREVLRTEYTNAIKNADLITIDLGTNNFGTFMTNRIQVILGIGGMEVDMDFTQFMDANTYQSMDAVLGQMVAQLVGGTDSDAYPLAKTLADTLLYGYLGFTTHFDASLEKIYELNPNAQVVVIDVYNMMSGVAMTGETFGDSIDLGQLYGIFVDMANLYTRELSPYAAKVTHASLDTDPELFFDYYADYPDDTYPENQYLHPTAERLMNEFVMEAMGYDPDEPEEREQFQKEIKDAIDTLDSYVNNLQATVKENVIDAEVVPGIKDGVQTAVDGVDASIEGVELVHKAVDGIALVNEAVDAVALADRIVTDIIVGTVLKKTMGMNPSRFKDVIISTAVETLADPEYDYLAEYGTDEELANLVYEISVLYYETEEKNGEAEARKVSIIAILEFVLKSEEQATLAYTVAGAYNTELASSGSEKNAMIAALASQLDGDTELAAQAYEVAGIYSAKLTETGSKESAMLAALTSQVGEEKAQQAMQVYAFYTQNGGGTDDDTTNSAARDATIVTMINTQYSQEGLAEAMYAVYCGKATAEQEQLAYIAAMVSAGIDQTVATAIYTCYATDLDGQYNTESVKTTMIFLMMKAMNMEQGTAEENYSSYLTYKNLPTTLSKIA
ncbi:MAG: hypothetical protein U0L15_08440, partial [Oscillospiraceae bacterium]|nr:hypothetical protein [Oscillospiraceae bacterium]